MANASASSELWPHIPPGINQDQTYPPPLSRVPAPIGGVPSPLDYAPSCLFTTLYALLVPVALYRLCAPRSRNLIVVFTLGVIVERCVLHLPSHSTLIWLLSMIYIGPLGLS